MDLIQVPIGPVTRARAKKFKEILNAFIQHIWAEESSWRSKGDNKSVVQIRCSWFKHWSDERPKLHILTDSIDWQRSTGKLRFLDLDVFLIWLGTNLVHIFQTFRFLFHIFLIFLGLLLILKNPKDVIIILGLFYLFLIILFYIFKLG